MVRNQGYSWVLVKGLGLDMKARVEVGLGFGAGVMVGFTGKAGVSGLS